MVEIVKLKIGENLVDNYRFKIGLIKVNIRKKIIEFDETRAGNIY